MKVLVIEDNEKLAQSLKRGLEQEGFSVDYLLDGESGQRRIEAKTDAYNAVILDVMLPKKDGMEVCREIRKESRVPIIMLTAKKEELDRILGLELGADDYVTKPFSVR